MLSDKQNKTLEDLKRDGFDTSEDIIIWCKAKLSLPRRHVGQKHTGRRKYTAKYYLDIISKLENNNL